MVKLGRAPRQGRAGESEAGVAVEGSQRKEALEPGEGAPWQT